MKKILLLILTFLLILFILEIGIKINLNYKEGNIKDSMFQKSDNKILVYENKNNYSFPNKLTIRETNSYGMRNYGDFDFEKDENSFRIVVLGDSVTAAP